MILGKKFKCLQSLCTANMKLEMMFGDVPSVGKVILTIYGDSPIWLAAILNFFQRG